MTDGWRTMCPEGPENREGFTQPQGTAADLSDKLIGLILNDNLLLYSKLNDHGNVKAKEDDRLWFPSASGPLSCSVIGCCSTVLVVAPLPEDHCCCRNNRKHERKHILSLKSKNVIADRQTPEYTHFLPLSNRQDVYCSQCKLAAQCVDSVSMWNFISLDVCSHAYTELENTIICVIKSTVSFFLAKHQDQRDSLHTRQNENIKSQLQASSKLFTEGSFSESHISSLHFCC